MSSALQLESELLCSVVLKLYPASLTSPALEHPVCPPFSDKKTMAKKKKKKYLEREKKKSTHFRVLFLNHHAQKCTSL